MPEWKVIGCFEPSATCDIPRLADAAAVHANSEAIVRATRAGQEHEVMSIAEFEALIENNEAFRMRERSWESDYVLLIPANELSANFVTIREAESHLSAFVAECRQQGAAKLKQGDERAALACFDRARRVSNDPDDVVRVCYLERTRDRGPWLAWLAKHAPKLDPLERARQLELVPKVRIFRSPDAKSQGQSSYV